MILNIVAFIVLIGVLVVVHELGHFLAARILGIEVKTFAFGFPPKIWAKKIGKTTYAINALPLGGYVSLKGEDEIGDDSQNDPTSLAGRSPLAQFFVFVSGVLMNVFLAFILFWIIFMAGFLPIFPGSFDYKGVSDTRATIVKEVEKDTPAAREGIIPGDQILAVDGKIIKQSEELISYIGSKAGSDGTTVSLQIKRETETLDKTLKTYKSKINQGSKEVEVNRVGVLLENTGSVKTGPIIALKAAFYETVRVTQLTVIGIGNLFSTIFTKFTLPSDITGPIGIFVATGVFASMGLTYYLQLAATISIALAVFNILPIPALDGGQIFFTLIEVITRRKFSAKTKNIIQMLGFSLLIALMIAVVIKDVKSFNILDNISGLFKR